MDLFLDLNLAILSTKCFDWLSIRSDFSHSSQRSAIQSTNNVNKQLLSEFDNKWSTLETHVKNVNKRQINYY